MKKAYEELEKELKEAKKIIVGTLRDLEKCVSEISALKTENARLGDMLQDERREWDDVHEASRIELSAVDGAVVLEVRSLSDVLELEERLGVPCDVTDVGDLIARLY